MREMARTALGPNRHPTRNGEPVSKGIPTTATSTPSSVLVCGSRMKVVIPQNRGVASESSGLNVSMAASVLPGRELRDRRPVRCPRLAALDEHAVEELGCPRLGRRPEDGLGGSDLDDATGVHHDD